MNAIEEIVRMDDPLKDLLAQARMRVYLKNIFYGRLLFDIELVEVTWCETACTDGLRVYYNRDFILSLENIDQVVFVLMHEFLHMFFFHVPRSQPQYDQKIWGLAIDMIVNFILITDKIGQMPSMGMFSRDFTDEMYPEEVYDLMMANREKYEKYTTVDEHLCSGMLVGNDGSVTDIEGGEAIPDDEQSPNISDDQIEANRREFADRVRAAASIGLASNEKFPVRLTHIINDLLSPRIPWGQLLVRFILSQRRTKRSFTRPSRRSIAMSASGLPYIPLPVRARMKDFSIHIANDCSVSMSKEQLREVHSEVAALGAANRNAEIMIMSFHDYVFNVREYDRTNMAEIVDYPYPDEGKGTNPNSIFEYLKEHKIMPKRLIIFGDGKNPNWGDPTYCPTLWIIHSDVTHSIVPPYGDYAYYDEPARRSFN